MASTSSAPTQPGTIKRTSFSGFPGGSASMFLDRAKSGMRGSTPDSEALVSSDDEQDQLHRLRPVTSNPGPKPTRRPSWLNEPQSTNRKASLGGSGPFSPASPTTTASSAEQSSWTLNSGATTSSALGRGHPAATSFPWGNTIWNSDSQKGPPQRLTEVLPSPTTLVPPGSAGLNHEEPLRSPPIGHDSSESAIPFAIPLQPTPKTYRSQSYSVGQLDPEASTGQPANQTNYTTAFGRQRQGTSYAGLQHRTSRPSVLGDLNHDPSLLGQLREVEDDVESSNDSDAGTQLSSQARAIEQLAMENAMLRQAAAEQMEKGRHRAKLGRTSGTFLPQRINDSVPEESDYTNFETDEGDGQRFSRPHGVKARRSSEYASKMNAQQTVSSIPEHRTLDSIKKGHWQSSLGFGGIVEPPQSRRHSFAEIPTRHNSIGSTGDSPSHATAETVLRSNGRLESPGGYSDDIVRPSQGETMTYFGRDSSLQSPPLSGNNMHQAYVQNQYGRPQYPLRPNQLLYLVTFKAQRADVFYVQEGTGLQVQKGDLVIVEADRGMDLGTVASHEVSITEAKELKDKYMQEQYQWLMVFSRHGQNGTVAGPNPNGQSSNANNAGNLTGSLPGPQELNPENIKPKMIKRLAQGHEVQTLREKEGSEAKAKRVCQQKVAEHRLNMEILEAEFQVDWKKLTFYYFADEYINFNPLVTDLFKLYKTRIWMSAINPASFQTPAGGLQIPGGATLGGETDQQANRRQQRMQPNLNQTIPNAYDPVWNPSRDGNGMNGMGYGQLYGQMFPSEMDPRQLDQYQLDYRQSMQPMLPFSNPGYNLPNLHHSSSFGSRPESSNGGNQQPQMLNRDWNQAMQGLSLGS